MKKNEIDMTEGPLFGKLLKFSIPIMASGILQLLFNAVDTIVVGRFVGDEALAAVGSTGALINLIIGLFLGVASGSNVLCAQYYGAKRKKDVEEVVHTSILISVIFGVILAVIGFAFSRTFLEWMDVRDKDVIELSSLYLKIYFLGCPAMLLYNFAASILRSVGDTKRPLIILTISGVLNVILNLVFVIGFGMSVEGVAIPTVITQVLSAVLITIVLIREDSMIKLVPKNIRIVRDKLFKMLRIGIPAGLQGCVFSLSNVLVQSSINGFGKLAMAGNTAAANLEGFVYQGMVAFHYAAINFTAQNIGAGKFDRIKKIMWMCLGIVLVVGLLLGNGIYFLSPYLLQIYTTTPESIEIGRTKLAIVSTTYAICGLMDVMSGMVKGTGASVTPMITSLTGACLTRIIWIFTVFQADHTLSTLFFCYPVSWTLTFLAHAVCFAVLMKRMKKRMALDAEEHKKKYFGRLKYDAERLLKLKKNQGDKNGT